MAKKIEVTITVKRNGKATTYVATETGESKGGTYLTFGTADSADMPKFNKLYIKTATKTAKPAKK